MPIQVKQEFPHCERCGKMVHTSRRRIGALLAARPVVFCSELCRDEYGELHELADRGAWVDGGEVAVRRRR